MFEVQIDKNEFAVAADWLRERGEETLADILVESACRQEFFNGSSGEWGAIHVWHRVPSWFPSYKYLSNVVNLCLFWACDHPLFDDGPTFKTWIAKKPGNENESARTN